MIWLTHNLFVGHPGEAALDNDLVWAETPGHAVHLIEEGYSVLLREDGNWEERASDVLGLLGASPEHIAWVLKWQRRVKGVSA